MSYVICPETITSPAPSVGAEAIGLTANMPCEAKCEVVREGPLMEFRCWRGHQFLATSDDIVDTPLS